MRQSSPLSQSAGLLPWTCSVCVCWGGGGGLNMLSAFYFVGREGGKRELAARDSSGVPAGTSENVALQNLSSLCCLGGMFFVVVS